TSMNWPESRALMSSNLGADYNLKTRPRLLSATPSTLAESIPIVEVDLENDFDVPPAQSTPEEDLEQRQFAIPLMLDGVVMGFLVTSREDRPWTSQEQHQIQAIAHTLTSACILDRRRAWFQQQFTQQQQVQAQQYNTLHSLLHQLKSPLTAVRTFAKLLLKRFLPEDRNYKVVDGLLRESDRLKELLQQVDQTLAISEEQAHLPPASDSEIVSETFDSSQGYIIEETHPNHPLTAATLLPASQLLEPTSIKAVLEPLIVSAQAIAEERHLDCIAEIPPQLPLVQANSKALREILSNIIDNALKYTPSPGCIYIQAHPPSKYQSSNQLAIAISDTGPGIPRKDLDHLFQRGYRGIQAQGNIPGTGLGLAIAQDLITEMEGKIQVFSPLNTNWIPPNLLQFSDRGQGTTFVVWLKLWG
ncbi:MAG: HAMP domain-containing sensor histidine kinase, partial [Cyanobacteriota bacterium]|nr:HAMP domain-containing sensor histidine kinase [Cyanobacteriota bacterium]